MMGKRIRLARQLAGLTQQGVASALSEAGIPATKAAISNYERGKRAPSARILLGLAYVLGVRTDYFFAEYDVKIEWLAYRRRSRLAKKIQESIKGYAQDVAALFYELRNLLYPGERATFPPTRAVDDCAGAEKAAQDLRHSWKLHPRNPIENLTATAEANGVGVIGWNRQTERFDGLSGWLNDHLPITVVNTSHQADRRRFSLAHELGHLLMRTEEEQSERLAHRFAAALLVPAEAAIHELGNQRPGVSLREFGMLKRRYGLSIQGWIIRARDLGIISNASADAFWPQLNRLGWKKEEPEEYAYAGDEQPKLLEQMIQRGWQEQLITEDRIRRVFPDYGEDNSPPLAPAGDFPSASELLAMPLEEREHWIKLSMEQVDPESYEILDTIDEYI